MAKTNFKLSSKWSGVACGTYVYYMAGALNYMWNGFNSNTPNNLYVMAFGLVLTTEYMKQHGLSILKGISEEPIDQNKFLKGTFAAMVFWAALANPPPESADNDSEKEQAHLHFEQN